jgi:hypothetical protein
MPKQIRGTFISFIPRLIGLSNYLSYRTTYRPYNCFLYSLTIQSSGILVDKYVRGLLESLTPGNSGAEEELCKQHWFRLYFCSVL